jgi:ATP synthase protein I
MAKRRRWAETSGTLANAYVIGIQFPIAILIGYFLGRWLDSLFGTRPWLMLVFSLFGIAAGFVNMIRMTIETTAREEAEEPGDDANQSNGQSNQQDS